MSNYQDKLRQYAQLLVRVGMNVQDKQPVFIRSSVDLTSLFSKWSNDSYSNFNRFKRGSAYSTLTSEAPAM
jgi:leucyl aminopeptidase (aminopeptidase T)